MKKAAIRSKAEKTQQVVEIAEMMNGVSLYPFLYIHFQQKIEETSVMIKKKNRNNSCVMIFLV